MQRTFLNRDQVKAAFAEKGFVFSVQRIAQAMRAGPHNIVNNQLFVAADRLDDIFDKLSARKAKPRKAHPCQSTSNRGRGTGRLSSTLAGLT